MSSSRGIGGSWTDSRASEGLSSPFRDTVEPLLKQLSGLSEAESAELRSLGEEGDAEIFWTELIRLGSKLEARDKLGAALPILSLAAASAPEEFQRRAQSRLEAIEGRGAIGGRVEFHLRRFARDAFSPEMILPMMAGSAVYGLTKGLALSRYAAAANPAWWMRGLAGRLSAASLAYAAEVPSFVLASRAMRLHSPQVNEIGFGQELAGAAITLGILKSTGSLAQSGLQKYLGSKASPALRFAVGQGAMFAGLASAYALEGQLGLRPRVEGDTAVTDILSSMVSLGIGSSLGHRLLGSGHELRSREFQTRIQQGGFELNFSKLSPPLGLAEVSGPKPMLMSGDPNGDGPKDRPIRKWPARKDAGSQAKPGGARKRKAPSKAEAPSAAEDPAKSQEAFELRAKAFAKATGSSFVETDIAFAQDLLRSLAEGKGFLPSADYRWEVLEAFESRLTQGEGPKYEALRNQVWRKYKVAPEPDTVFFNAQPIDREEVSGLTTAIDMSEWPAPWHEVRDLTFRILGSIKRHRFWTGESKGVQVSRLNELIEDFGPGKREPGEALLALAQFERYRNQEIGYVSLRHNLMDLLKHGEVRAKPAPLPATQYLPTPPEVADSRSISLKTFEFYADRNPAWKEVAQRLREVHEKLSSSGSDEIWRDRFADLIDRGMELADEESNFTAPKALRWLEAFEASHRGEKTWEEFEAIDPLTVKPQPRNETPPPRSEPGKASSKPASEAPPNPAEPAVAASPLSPAPPTSGQFRLASALRLFTIPQAAADGSKEFEVRLFLPSLKQLRWRMVVNSQGEMSLPEGSSAAFEVEKVEGFSGRFRLREASHEFLIDLQSVQDRSGNVQRLELATVQAASNEGAKSLFSSQSPALAPVQVEHAEMVAFNSVKGEGGFQFRYHLHLSNGDRAIVVGHTTHRQGGQVEIHEARIQRFGQEEPSSQAMEISVSRVKARHHRVLLSDESGYRLDLEFKSPIGAEKWRPSWTRLEVTNAPEPVHLRWAAPEASVAAPVDVDSSIRELSADVLSGKIEAVEKLGVNGREHDLALWELRELFEMTWQAGAKDADFGGIDLILLREKIGGALREAARENPFAKRILGQLEQVYGLASLIEAPAPVPMAKTVPPVLPPPAPAVVESMTRPMVEVEAPPKVKPPKPPKAPLTPLEKTQQTIDKALRGSLQRILSHEVTGELIKDLEKLGPEELRVLAERTADRYDQAATGKDLRELFLYYALGVLLSRSRGLNYVDPIVMGLQAGSLPGGPRQLPEFVRGLGKKLIYRPGSHDLFKARSADSSGIAELRRRMRETIKISPAEFERGTQAQSENFGLAQSLSSHEAQRLREELIEGLQFLYRQTMIATRLGLPAQAKEYQTEIAVGFAVFLGLTVDRMDSNYTSLAMRRLGVSIFDEHPGVFYFHPFPEQFSTMIKIQLPPLDLGAARHIFKPSKK